MAKKHHSLKKRSHSKEKKRINHKNGIVFKRHGSYKTDSNFSYNDTKNHGTGELYLAGDLVVDGIIDQTGLIFAPQLMNPIQDTNSNKTLWYNKVAETLYIGGTQLGYGTTGATGPIGPVGPTGSVNMSDLNSHAWILTGNTGTNGSKFIGTIDNQPLVIKTNNVARLNINTTGQLETLNTGDSVFLGEGAGIVDDLTSNGNVFIGKDAGHLNSSGDKNVAVGYQASYSNATSGFNTAIGYQALYTNTDGVYNATGGYQAMFANTTGSYNTSFGVGALASNTTGGNNTAIGIGSNSNSTIGFANTSIGSNSLHNNISGVNNTATGFQSLNDNTIGCCNTADGYQSLLRNISGNNNVSYGMYALINNTTGSNNIAIGMSAGTSIVTGNDNILIGNGGNSADSNTTRIGLNGVHNRSFISGIRGVMTGVNDAVNIMIDSVGQLGTISSSARYKNDIQDMGESTANLINLRPVTFRYNQACADNSHPINYGLIAEEVATIYPDLVVYDKDGLPETVQYHKLVPMLLNELKRTNTVIQDLITRVTALEQK
jgi:hypothetical protein